MREQKWIPNQTKPAHPWANPGPGIALVQGESVAAWVRELRIASCAIFWPQSVAVEFFTGLRRIDASRRSCRPTFTDPDIEVRLFARISVEARTQYCVVLVQVNCFRAAPFLAPAGKDEHYLWLRDEPRAQRAFRAWASRGQKLVRLTRSTASVRHRSSRPPGRMSTTCAPRRFETGVVAFVAT